MRAINLYHGRKSRRDATNRGVREQLVTRLVLAALLAATALAGWQLERRLGADRSMRGLIPASGDDTYSEASRTIAEIRAAGARQRAFSEDCTALTAADETRQPLNFCAPLEQTAPRIGGEKVTTSASHLAGPHDRATHLYRARTSSAAAVTPPQNQRLAADADQMPGDTASRGWNTATAFQEAFGAGRAELVDRVGRARDF